MRQAAPHQVGIEAHGASSTVAHPPLALGAVRDAGDDQRLGDDVADRAPRIERGDRVLEDQLQAAAHQAHAPRRAAP